FCEAAIIAAVRRPVRSRWSAPADRSTHVLSSAFAVRAREELTMKTILVLLLSLGAISVARASGPCGPDAVPAGTACLDRYEASVWRVPNPATTNALLVRKIQLGIATASDLASGGAMRLGVGSDDYAPCTDDGQNCSDDIF